MRHVPRAEDYLPIGQTLYWVGAWHSSLSGDQIQQVSQIPRAKQSIATATAALGLCILALPGFAAGGTSTGAADAFARAEALRHEGSRQSAPHIRELYRQSIDTWRLAHDGCGARRGWVALSSYEHDLSNAQGQKLAAQQALAERCTGDVPQQALAEKLLGSAFINQGDFANGMRETQRAVQLFRQIGDRHEEAASLRNLGLACAESGELDKALALTRTTLELARKTADQQLLALVRNDLALVYNMRGEFASAVEAYQSSLAGLREHPYPLAEAVAWINLGLAYGQLGDGEQALSAFAHGETAARVIECWSCLAEIEADRADDLFDQHQFAEAEAAYQRALELANAHQLVRQHAEALRGLGRCAMQAGRWQQAGSLLRAARDELHRSNGRLNESVVFSMLGDLDGKTAHLADARNNYEEALKLATEASNPGWQAVAHASLARLDLRQGDPEAAKQSMQRALALIESERTRINAPDLRTGYFSTKRSYYELYVDILMQLDRVHPDQAYSAEALLAAERARTRQFQDQLAERAIDISRHVDPKLLQAQSQAQDHLRSLAYQLSQISAEDSASRQRLQERIDEASRALDSSRGRIHAANPSLAELTYPTALTVQEIRERLLDDNTSVVEFWLGEEQSYVWIVTRQSLHAFRLPSRPVIEQDAESFRTMLLAPSGQAPSESVEKRAISEAAHIDALDKRGAALGARILPAEARPLLRNVIAVVPDGPLQRLPFVLLHPRETESKSTAYVYLQSMSTLRALRTAHRSQAGLTSVAVIADPVFRVDDVRLTGRTSSSGESTSEALLRAAGEVGLSDLRRLPNTREEAEGIRAMADSKSWIALDFAANRTAMLEAPWARYSVVHFATHALVNSRHPELSGIVLSLYDASGHSQDGFLRASDIYNLTMPADLVVLSVCDSAIGKDVGAEGPATLARAFFYAGAHRVVASLWPVDDRASVSFMRAFYRGLIERRMAPHEALAAAQQELKATSRWRNPYYWAPYVLQGDWRSRSGRVENGHDLSISLRGYR